MAFWSAFSFSFLVFAFWLGSFSGVAGKMGDTVGGKVADAVASAKTPAESLLAGVGDIASAVWERVVGPKKVEYSEIQILPGKN